MAKVEKTVRIQPWIGIKTWKAVKRRARIEGMTLNACVDWLLRDALYQLRCEAKQQTEMAKE